MEEREIARALYPQSQLDLIMSIDLLAEQVDVRSTVIYDLDFETKIFVAQTIPPIFRSNIGETITASFVIYDREANLRRRFGFEAQVLDVIPDYEIRADVIEPAVAISYPTKGVEESVVRLFYRVEPAIDHNITVQIPDDPGESHVLDLSMGGMMISYRGPRKFEEGHEVLLKVEFMKEPAEVLGEVRRVFEREGSRMINVGFKFLEVEPELGRLIQRTVTEIMRTELKERSGLAHEEETLATPKTTRPR